MNSGTGKKSENARGTKVMSSRNNFEPYRRPPQKTPTTEEKAKEIVIETLSELELLPQSERKKLIPQ